jgi:DNA-binding MarR family transcriptional regulator
VNVTTPTVVKMATRMAAAGLVTRRADRKDSRLVRLWLTERGRALRAPIEAERQALEESVTASLTEAERKHLLKALTKVHDAAIELMRHAEAPDADG